MSQMFQDLTKFDTVFTICMLCLLSVSWVLGIWKLIEIVF